MIGNWSILIRDLQTTSLYHRLFDTEYLGGVEDNPACGRHLVLIPPRLHFANEATPP